MYALLGGAYSKWTQLIIHDYVIGKSFPVIGNFNLGPDWNPSRFSWSPDGTVIAFVGDPDHNDIDELNILNSEGSDQILLVDDNCIHVI